MDTIIHGLSLKKREWLARFIQRNKKLPKEEQVKRCDIPDMVNREFPGTNFRISQLLHLYTRFKGQGSFITKTFEEVRKVQSEEASKAKAPLKKKTGPVQFAPASGIERPPKAKAKKKKSKPKPKPVPAAKPVGLKPKPIPVETPKPVAKPTQPPSPKPEHSEAKMVEAPPPIVEPAPKPVQVKPRPKLKLPADSAALEALKKITPEESKTIALAIGNWDPSTPTPSGSAFGYAAIEVNKTRLGEKRPLLDAQTVRMHVLGKQSAIREGVESFLGHEPAFATAFPDKAAAIAERVAAYKPPPHP